MLSPAPDAVCSSQCICECRLLLWLMESGIVPVQVFEILEAAGTAILFVIIYHVWAGA